MFRACFPKTRLANKQAFSFSSHSLLLLFLLLLVFLFLGFLSILLLLLLLLFLLLFLLVTRVTTVSLSIDSFSDLERGVLQALEGVVDLVGVLGDDGLVERRDVALNLVLDVLRDASAVLLDLLLSVVDELIGLVLKIDNALHGLIRLLGSLSLLDHAVDISIRETTAGADSDLLLLAGGLVLGANVHDTVGVDIEGNLNLGNTTGSHGDALKIEIAQLLVVLGELTLTLQHRDADLGLVVGSS